jgi:hypothetical protein
MQALRRLAAISMSSIALAASLARLAAAAGPPDNGLIAFERTVKGNTDIYTMHSDGTGLVRLTAWRGIDRQPSWSADSQTVVFSSDRTGTFDLWEKGTGSPVQLTSGPASDRAPAWSPDGTTIAFVRAQSHHAEIWLLDVGAKSVSQLTHDGARDGHPTWLPDGSIVYDSDRSGMRELWAVDSGGSSTPIDVGPGNNSDPSASTQWELSFASDRTGATSIWQVVFGGGPPHSPGTPYQLTDGSSMDGAPTWSPYGIWVTFVRGTGAKARLFRTRIGEGSATQLTFGPGGDGDPSGTFRDKAADDQMKANLEQALADASVIYGQDGSFGGVTNARLAGVDSSLIWQTGASSGPDVMSWAVGLGFNGPNQAFAVAAVSPGGVCLYTKDIKDWPGGERILYGYTFTAANCTGTYALANANAFDWGF